MNYKIKTEKPTLLSEIIKKNHINVSLPCGGHNNCGRCKVTVFGDISEASQKEKEILSADELKNNVRLACYTTVLSECSIILPDEAKISNKSEFAAVDVGTTSVEVKYSDGMSVKLKNPQMAYGADVISRITNSENFYNELNESIVSCLKKLIGTC